uniref:Uncharacterized protein n=1 Tax=Arundo donax TaxID=35708 RepID=A0A0A9E9D0_ARUDO
MQYIIKNCNVSFRPKKTIVSYLFYASEYNTK